MKKLIIILISIISLSSASAQKYTDQYIKDASIVAESWLSDINNKHYETAFNMMSEEAKILTNQEYWISLIDELMLEFGELEIRSEIGKKFQSEVEGIEDGFYVFIDYNVSYTNTKNHKEHLLLKQNDETMWKIVYYNYEFQNIEE